MIPVGSYSPPRMRITLMNDRATKARPVGPYIRARFGWYWKIPGTGMFQVKYDHPLAQRIMQCKRNVVPVRVEYNGVVWTGRVFEAEVSGEPGNEVVTATCIGDLFWLATILGWVNPLMPPWIQVALTGKQDVMAGSLDFVAKYYLTRNSVRLGKPIFVAVPVQYHSELPRMEDIDSLDDLLDLIHALTEDLCVLSSRFTQLDELIDGPFSDSERGMSMRLHVPDLDGESPTVFTARTTSQLQTAAGLATASDNFLGTMTGKLTEPGLIFDTHMPRDRQHMTWRTDNGTIRHYSRKVKHPTGHSVIVGGKAPEFINDLIEWAANLAIKTLLNWLIPGAGLGDILVGDLLDDILFAYQQFDDYVLEHDLGPFGFGEQFGDNTSAYSLDATAVGLAKLKEIGPQEVVKLEVVSGTPGAFSFGVDDGSGRRFLVGDRMTFYDKGTYLEDYVAAVEVEDSPGVYCAEFVTIGDDRAIKGGWEKLAGILKGLSSFTRAIANGTN